MRTAEPSPSSSSFPYIPELAGRIADAFEARIREQETMLSPLAVRSYETRGRATGEEECGLRTPFQRDRDRIVHSKSFRRLKHKTRVFIDPKGDHYRTRLTHTLETAEIAMQSRGLFASTRISPKAIALGHDLGHPPFGHAGEEVLGEVVFERYGRRFRHNEQSLRVVDVLEKEGRGLNLTEEVRDGILEHGAGDPATLEGKIVRLVADRVAYINHDIDDALRAGILSHGDLPQEDLELLGETGARRIDRLVHDIVEDLGRGRRHRPVGRDRARDAQPARLHVRARLPRPGRAGTARYCDRDRAPDLRPPCRAPGGPPEGLPGDISSR